MASDKGAYTELLVGLIKQVECAQQGSSVDVLCCGQGLVKLGEEEALVRHVSAALPLHMILSPCFDQGVGNRISVVWKQRFPEPSNHIRRQKMLWRSPVSQ